MFQVLLGLVVVTVDELGGRFARVSALVMVVRVLGRLLLRPTLPAAACKQRIRLPPAQNRRLGRTSFRRGSIRTERKARTCGPVMCFSKSPIIPYFCFSKVCESSVN